MKDNMWIYLVLGHRSFKTGKTVIVAVPDYCTFITEYENEAKKKACKEIGLNESEVHVLECKVIGRDVLFIG